METARNPRWKSLLIGGLWVLNWLLASVLGVYVAMALISPGLFMVSGLPAAVVLFSLLGARRAERRGKEDVMAILLVTAILAELLALLFALGSFPRPH